MSISGSTFTKCLQYAKTQQSSLICPCSNPDSVALQPNTQPLHCASSLKEFGHRTSVGSPSPPVREGQHHPCVERAWLCLSHPGMHYRIKP